jgi:hypothetical protein
MSSSRSCSHMAWCGCPMRYQNRCLLTLLYFNKFFSSIRPYSLSLSHSIIAATRRLETCTL